MISDKDIAKMKKVFATKDDLKPIRTDLKRVEKKIDQTKQAVNDLTEYIEPALGNVFRWTDDIHAALVGKKSSKQHPEN